MDTVFEAWWAQATDRNNPQFCEHVPGKKGCRETWNAAVEACAAAASRATLEWPDLSDTTPCHSEYVLNTVLQLKEPV